MYSVTQRILLNELNRTRISWKYCISWHCTNGFIRRSTLSKT